MHASTYSSTLIIAARAALQSPSSTRQDKPAPPDVTFQIEVNYVDVDVVVTDEKGNFVSGLTREDFEVFEDGKPQKVDTFTLCRNPARAGQRLRARRPDGARATRSPTASRLPGACTSSSSTTRTSARCGPSQVKKSAKEFVEQVHGRERHRGRHPYQRPNRRRAGVHEQQAAAACRHRQVHGPAHALAHDRAARRRTTSACRRLQRQHRATETEPTPSTDPGGHSRMEPTDFERGFRAVGVLDTLRLTAEFLDLGAGPPQGGPLLQRRHRLPHLRTRSAARAPPTSSAPRRTPSRWPLAPT